MAMVMNHYIETFLTSSRLHLESISNVLDLWIVLVGVTSISNQLGSCVDVEGHMKIRCF